jgi:transcriptional regulator with XRE-family HTH domain
MADLRKRFGELLAAHRRRRGLTQEDLAEAAGLSVDMISKIEVGATGARFPSIERLARAVLRWSGEAPSSSDWLPY